MALCAITALAGAVPCWRVCAALAAGQEGGTGAASYRPPPLAVPPSRPSRGLKRVGPSGCPLPLPAGSPVQVVCAFRVLGPGAVLVRRACPLAGCVLALSRCLRLSPSPCLIARALRETSSQGAGRAVPGGSCPSAFPAPVPCSACRRLGRDGRSVSGVSIPVSRWLRGVRGLHSPSPDRPSLGRAAGAHCSLSLGAGGAGVGACRHPHSAGGRPGGGGARSAPVRVVRSWEPPFP